MNNFSYHRPNLLNALAFFLLSVVLLQGCGAERTTPFNPPKTNCSSSSSSSSSSSDSSSSSSTSSSSSSSSSSCYSSSSTSSSNSSSSSSSSSSSATSSSSSGFGVDLIVSATSAASSLEDNDKNYKVIRDETTYNKWATAYIGQPSTYSVDFEVGQVILIDDGVVNNCNAHLSFNSNISVRDLSNVSVAVSLGYDEEPEREGTCIPTSSRPFYFYYIGTRKQLTVADKVQ